MKRREFLEKIGLGAAAVVVVAPVVVDMSEPVRSGFSQVKPEGGVVDYENQYMFPNDATTTVTSSYRYDRQTNSYDPLDQFDGYDRAIIKHLSGT